MAYAYIKAYYHVNPEPGKRVKMKDSQRFGTIARKHSYDRYVWVTFDGTKFNSPCHPLDLDYLDKEADV